MNTMSSENLTSKTRSNLMTHNEIITWLLPHCTMHNFTNKTTVIKQGSVSNSLFYIIKGRVVVFVKQDLNSTKEILLNHFEAGQFFGEIGLFDNLAQYRTAGVRTKEASTIAEISHQKFKQLIQMNPNILMTLSGQIAQRLHNTSSQMKNMKFLNVAQHIAQTMIDLSHNRQTISHPLGYMIKISRKEIGQIIGYTRETVGRILKVFADNDLITAHGKSIVLLKDENQPELTKLEILIQNNDFDQFIKK